MLAFVDGSTRGGCVDSPDADIAEERCLEDADDDDADEEWADAATDGGLFSLYTGTLVAQCFCNEAFVCFNVCRLNTGYLYKFFINFSVNSKLFYFFYFYLQFTIYFCQFFSEYTFEYSKLFFS